MKEEVSIFISELDKLSIEMDLLNKKLVEAEKYVASL